MSFFPGPVSTGAQLPAPSGACVYVGPDDIENGKRHANDNGQIQWYSAINLVLLPAVRCRSRLIWPHAQRIWC